jgi:hypothetical protein
LIENHNLRNPAKWHGPQTLLFLIAESFRGPTQLALGLCNMPYGLFRRIAALARVFRNTIRQIRQSFSANNRKNATRFLDNKKGAPERPFG